MRSAKSDGLTEIDQSLEKDLGASIHALTRTNAVFHRSENRNHETSGDNLGTLLRRVSETSTREVEGLIDELHGLRKKLESQSEHIQSEILRYTELSQGVMQLTMIISENVKKLTPSASDTQ
jgi:hypothetical protein